MPTIDDGIRIIDNAICRYLDNLDGSTRGVISQDILAHLRNLVEHVMLKYYSPHRDIDDTEENIINAVEYAQIDGRLKVLYRFRNYLEIVASHYTLDEDSSERLMLKYYDYLLEIKIASTRTSVSSSCIIWINFRLIWIPRCRSIILKSPIR